MTRSLLSRTATPLIPFVVAVVGLSVILSLSRGDGEEWMSESWGFAKQIMPLLAVGVLIAGFLLGTQDGGWGIIPHEWIAGLVGGNSAFANFFASIVGACIPTFAYQALQTEEQIGLLLPCNVIVYVDSEDQTVVSAINPTIAMNMVDNPAVGGVAGQISEKLEKVIANV